jgi:hypothetical protein
MGDFGSDRCEEEIVRMGEVSKELRAMAEDPRCREDVREVLRDLVVIASERILQMAARREARLKRLTGSIVR